MDLLLSLLIAFVVGAYVAAPFFRKDPRGTFEAPDDQGPEGELLAEKETLYAAIQELDFDYRAGKVSEADYRALRTKYEAEAVSVLKRLDAVAAGRSGRGAGKG